VFAGGAGAAEAVRGSRLRLERKVQLERDRCDGDEGVGKMTRQGAGGGTEETTGGIFPHCMYNEPFTVSVSFQARLWPMKRTYFPAISFL